MTDDIWKQKVRNDLREDLEFYNKEIENQSQNLDTRDSVAVAKLEQLRRERDERARELDKAA